MKDHIQTYVDEQFKLYNKFKNKTLTGKEAQRQLSTKWDSYIKQCPKRKSFVI